MKSATLSVLLSVISLAAVSVLYLKVDELSDEVRLSRSGRPDVGRRAPEEDRDLSYRDTSYRDRDATARADARSDAGGSPAADGGGSTDVEPESVEERLAKLEREVKRSRSNRMPVFRGPRFVRNLDDLTDHLKLTRSQRDRVQDSIRRGRERIDAIMSVPAADGVSPKQAQEERRKKLEELVASPEKDHGKILQLAMGGRRKLNEKVPGSNETYADQIKRVKQETRDEVNSGLSAEQQDAFEDTNIDGLVGGGGSGTTMSFVTTTTASGPDEGGATEGIVIESGDDVSIDVEVEDE